MTTPYFRQDPDFPSELIDLQGNRVAQFNGVDHGPDEQEAMAALAGMAHQMHDLLKLAQRALNTAPNFRVDDTNSYAIAARIDALLEGRAA